MWCRTVEVMLGLWLVISPFVFAHGDGETLLWASDLASGTAVIVISLASFHARVGAAHFLNLLVAGWLIGFGYFGEAHPVSAALQNDLTVGLLLAMFGVLPNRADMPPAVWVEFEAGKPAAEEG